MEVRVLKRKGENVFHDIRIKIYNWLARESRSVYKMKNIQKVFYLSSLLMTIISFVGILINSLYVMFLICFIALSWAIKSEKLW